MPSPTKARPDWVFDPKKPDAERTIKADDLKHVLLSDDGGLDVENAIVAGPFKARDLREFHNFVNFRRTRFLDAIDLSDVHFHRSVHFINCEFRGNLDLSSTEIDGDLNLQDTSVVGNLDIHDAMIHDHLYLTGTQVGGDVELVRSEVMRNLSFQPTAARRAVVAGKADLGALEVHGQTSLMGLHVKGDLNLQQVELRAGLFCRAWKGATGEPVPTRVDGSVSLIAAKVSDLVDFSGSAIQGHLEVSRANITGEADFAEVSLGGKFDLQGTRIPSKVIVAIRDARTTPRTPMKKDDHAADLRDSVISHLSYDATASPDRLVMLNFAQIDVLEFPGTEKQKDSRERLTSIPTRTTLEGLRFSDFEFPEGRDEVRDAMAWLESDTLEPESTTRQIEKWFRNKGNHEKANKFYLKLQRRLRRTRVWYIRILERVVIDWGTQYGLRTSRLLGVFVVFFVLSFALFADASSTVIREDRREGARHGTVNLWGERTVENWNWLDAMWMAMRLNLPMIDLPATTDWKPSSAPLRIAGFALESDVPGVGWHVGLTYRDYGSLISLLGYLMVPLYFAGSIHYWFQQRNPHE